MGKFSGINEISFEFNSFNFEFNKTHFQTALLLITKNSLLKLSNCFKLFTKPNLTRLHNIVQYRAILK